MVARRPRSEFARGEALRRVRKRPPSATRVAKDASAPVQSLRATTTASPMIIIIIIIIIMMITIMNQKKKEKKTNN